jgi:hypothetical protein
LLSTKPVYGRHPLCENPRMILADGSFGLILLAVWIFCIIDVITTPETAVRNLPKVVWLLIVLLLADVGSIAWLVAGRSWNGAPRARTNDPAGARFPEYDRPGRHIAASADDDEQFLAQVRQRADAQRRQYDARRKAELQDEQARLLRRPEDDPPR